MKFHCALLFKGEQMVTSKGNQAKFSCDVDGQKMWYKADFLGYEGAAEYACSCLLKASNIPSFVSYSIEKVVIGDKLFNGCKSADFLQKNESIVTIEDLIKKELETTSERFLKGLSLEEKIKKTVDFVESVTHLSGFGTYLTSILEFDMLTLNEDRHFNNIAIIRSSNGTYSFCPIFDNGGAFMSDISSTGYPLTKDTIGQIPDVKSKPFSADFDNQVKACEKLYGRCLAMDHIALDDNSLLEIQNIYGNEIAERIGTISRHQEYMYSEYLVEKEIKQTK